MSKKQEKIREQIQNLIIQGSVSSHTKTSDTTDKTLSYLHSQGCVLKVDKELPDIELVFANVAGSTPERHKNVLGDKWKYINAVNDALAHYVAVEPIIKKEVKRDP